MNFMQVERKPMNQPMLVNDYEREHRVQMTPSLLTNEVSVKTNTPQWVRSAKNRDVSTGPLARPFARSLAPLTRSLAPDCSLRSRPPLRSLVRSLAHFAHSLARGTVNDWMAILSVFFSIFDHSARPANDISHAQESFL